MRRALTIIAILIVLLGIGVGVYFYFFSSTASVTVAPSPSGTNSLPTAGQGALPTDTTNTGNGTAGGGASPVKVTARLVQIDKGPVVVGESAINVNLLADGTLATSTKAGTTTPDVAVSYIERQSGNVFSYLVHANTLTRINNKTVLGLQSASWLPNASSALVRFLSGDDFSTVNTYSLSATTTDGFFLTQNLTDVAVSSLGILSVASGVNGSAVSLSRADGTKPSVVFTTPLSSIRASFAGKSYLAFTKPSATLSGYAYLVSSGHFSRIAGPLNGLVALASPSGKLALVSYTNGTTMTTELVNTATGVVNALPVGTIADKCVWTSDDTALYCGVPVSPPTSYTYPDDWYQGAVHFSDRIWKIDVTSHYAQLVLDFSTETKGTLDATALAIDPNKTVLIFLNKNDGSLWSYQL